jgi:polyhydroxyalkanoate synthesis repressor PhaR
MLVKKYGNRRLYDTDKSKYVRLDEIAERIRAGADVRVVDAQTDADLTAPTLAQIIFEDRNAARLLPVPLLLQLIRMGDGPLADFLGQYVSWALEIYLQTRTGMASLYNPFAGFPGFAAPPPPPMPPAAPHPAPAPAAPQPTRTKTSSPEPKAAEPRDEIAELRREMAELRRAMKPKKPRKR